MAKVLKLAAGKKYTIPGILAGHSECSISNPKSSLIKKCVEVSAMVRKIYGFDSMVKKLMDAVTLKVLEQNIPMYWLDDCNALTTMTSFGRTLEGGVASCGSFRGLVMLSETPIAQFYLNVQTKNGNAGLDGLYMVFPHEIAHLYFGAIYNKAKSPLPYKTLEQKEAFTTVAEKVITNILTDMGYKATGQYVTDRKTICKESARLNEVMMQKVQEGYLTNQNLNMGWLNKHQEFETINNALCGHQTEELQLVELAVRHFEQIVNGLESDIGVKHEDLVYLKPLVEYTKEHLYPEMDAYIKQSCDESSKFKCHFDQNQSLKFIELVAATPHEEL